MVIDTSVFIEFLRAKNKQQTKLFGLPTDQQLYISAVTLYELLMGATNADQLRDVDLLISGIPVLPFEKDVATQSGAIYQQLRTENKLIEFRDLFIAATCLKYGLPLYTLNKKHFFRISSLILVD